MGRYEMKAAIYARVSDIKLKEDGQRRQDIDRQVSRLMTIIPDKEIMLFKDDGLSAFKEDYNSRPEFLRMLREIRGNHVNRVYVESLDRISRRVAEGLPLLEEIASHNCTVISISEGEIDTTSSPGWLRTGIFLLMAEWASRDKSDKVKSGLERRRNDKRKVCRSCGVVHMGRHPITCLCEKCRPKATGIIRKGRSETALNSMRFSGPSKS